jgi:hypothetical protein
MPYKNHEDVLAAHRRHRQTPGRKLKSREDNKNYREKQKLLKELAKKENPQKETNP